jgi:hypothetical protein
MNALRISLLFFAPLNNVNPNVCGAEDTPAHFASQTAELERIAEEWQHVAAEENADPNATLNAPATTRIIFRKN